MDDERPVESEPGSKAQGSLEDVVRRAARARGESLRAVGEYGSLGMSFVIAIVLGAAAGYWLDKLTGWSPVLFLVCFFLGLAAGVLNVFKVLSKPR